MVLCLLSGCDKGDGSASEKDSSKTPSVSSGVVLTVVSPFNSNDPNRNNFVKAYIEYEQKTGDTIKDDFAIYPDRDWINEVLDSFKNGREPDVLFFYTVGADADKLIQSGRLVSLEEIRANYPGYAENVQNAFIPVAFDGMRYAVPMGSGGYYITKKAWDDSVKSASCVSFVTAMTNDEMIAVFSDATLSDFAHKSLQ